MRTHQTEYKDQFIEWYVNDFTTSNEYISLQDIVPNETLRTKCKNMAKYTDVIINRYISILGPVWEVEDLLGAYSCAFGSISADQTKPRESGITASRTFEKYYVQHNNEFKVKLSPIELLGILTTIQYFNSLSTIPRENQFYSKCLKAITD